jgi:hypothetical protein
VLTIFVNPPNHRVVNRSRKDPAYLGCRRLPLMSGLAYLEFGGSYFNLSGPNPNWADAYIKGLVSRGSNVLPGELTRQSRYGGTGWYYSFGWTRTWSKTGTVS